MESAQTLLQTGRAVVAPHALAELIAEKARRASAMKAAGETRAHRRLVRAVDSLCMFRDRGKLSGEIIPKSDLTADYRGKFMVIGLQGNLIPWRVYLRSGDDWHREIVRNFEEEVCDFGFENFQTKPLGGAFIDCSPADAVALWGASEEFGACSFEKAAQLIEAALPDRRGHNMQNNSGDRQRLSTAREKREVYRGKHFAFMVEQVTHPNGVQTEMGIVRHPGSTVIVPFFEDETIGLIHQYRHAVAAYVYETPAGTMEPGEDPLVCAHRELEEETGVKATHMTYLGKTLLLPAYSDEVTYIYLARNLIATRQSLDSDEIIEVHRLPVDRVLAMIASGEIVDALSILSIYHAVNHLGLGPGSRRF